MVKYLCFCAFLLFFQNSYCDIGGDLEGFFHKMGTTTNTTSPGVHHDQSAGYYSGGGLSVRNRARNSQLATLQLPNFKAGCGGIDMFTGGFSFVSSAELVNALKSIGSSAASYGFMLAMKTFAPSVQSVMAELQDMASKINQANINSCETAATLLGGVWPKSDLTSRHICTSIGSGGGMFKTGRLQDKDVAAVSRVPESWLKRESAKNIKTYLQANLMWRGKSSNGIIFCSLIRSWRSCV